MNYSEIKTYDIANGPGVRVTIFVSGCTHHCKGCFNEMTWDFAYGEPFTEQTIDTILSALAPDYIAGLTMLGGEPLEEENRRALLPLLQAVKEKFPTKNIWCYSGYLFERDILEKFCLQWAQMEEFLSYLDVIVDGPFLLEQKDISLQFRGSGNQRIIRVRESLEQGEIVLWEDRKNR